MSADAKKQEVYKVSEDPTVIAYRWKSSAGKAIVINPYQKGAGASENLTITKLMEGLRDGEFVEFDGKSFSVVKRRNGNSKSNNLL